jgi:hypothetical protein
MRQRYRFFLQYVRSQSLPYSRVRNATTTSYSELLMHCRMAGKRILAAYVRQDGQYGYVMTHDGQWTDGIWRQWDDGTVSLS